MTIKLKLAIGVLLAAFLVLGGCAGNASFETTGGGGSFAGVYDATYSRASGTMTIGVDNAGSVSVAVVDDPAGFFSGVGSLNADNTFSVVCAGPGGATVTVTGTFAGSGAGRTASGTTSGAFTVAYTAPFGHALSQAIFAGHYEGFYGGGEAGLFSGDVDSGGHFTGTWTFTGRADTTISGNISSTGFCSFTGAAGGVTTNLNGVFYLSPAGNAVLCRGNWDNSASHVGFFEGGNANEG